MGLFYEKVYCQTCGEKVVGDGCVSDLWIVYHTNAKCIPNKKQPDKEIKSHTQKEIQQMKKENKLLYYHPLQPEQRIKYYLGQIDRDFPREFSKNKKRGFFLNEGNIFYIEGDELYIERMKKILKKNKLERMFE